MLHHASRLVNTAPVVLATDFINSSLTEILQTAAGRAWVRRVNTNSISGKNGALHAKRDFYQPS
jgi:hypothetical protein